MKRWLTLVALMAIPLVLFGTPVAAQDDDEEAAVSHSEDDWDDGLNPRYALGFGYGLVNLDEEAFEDDVEPYLMASFRIRMGKNSAKQKGMRGYLEPEIGYWNRDSNGNSSSDLLIGLNVVGVQPLGAVDFFVGGGLGVHFLDQDLVIDDDSISESATSIGANANFGVDVHLSQKISLFAAGRFDIVEERNDLEAKAYMGLRIFFP
jgi:hypothetical protein